MVNFYKIFSIPKYISNKSSLNLELFCSENNNLLSSNILPFDTISTEILNFFFHNIRIYLRIYLLYLILVSIQLFLFFYSNQKYTFRQIFLLGFFSFTLIENFFCIDINFIISLILKNFEEQRLYVWPFFLF